MVDITTEQQVGFVFQVKDGRGRTKGVEGTPSAVSSDETVCTVSLAAGADTAWNGMVVSVAPGSARVVVDADADLGEGVQDVVGTLDVNVTLDPRTGARIVEMTAGAPEDKAA